jgi:tetratricopeptide (TPR) repeat protein
MACLNRSVQLDYRNALAWYHLGMINAVLGEYGRSLECYNQSITLDPYNAAAWNNKGFALARLGKNESALYSFKNAALLDPQLEGANANCVILIRGLGLENKSEYAYFIKQKVSSHQDGLYFQSAPLPPAFMDADENVQAKRSPGLYVTSAIFIILGARFYLRERRR